MPKSFPKKPVTIGQHIRRARMQKRLLQRDVANILGVSTACITNWENGNSEPQLQYFPTLTSFLGFSPFSANYKTFPERLRTYRLERGLSFKRMGLLFDVHGSTVISWEKGEFVPAEETLKKLRVMGNLDLEDLIGSCEDIQQLIGRER